ncbi:MAG: hypothetical protein GX918_04820 [Clostridiales bacterium]|nr:hypothetical protein [Clostridiales bacterium]
MEYRTALEAYLDSIEAEIEALGHEHSRFEKATQDCLHYLENSDICREDSFRFFKNFKAIREERRIIKDKLETLHYIRRSIEQAEKNGYSNGKRPYAYRVLVPKSIKGEELEWKI